jgi:hypothetical protein
MKNGAPKGTILELSCAIMWQVCHNLDPIAGLHLLYDLAAFLAALWRRIPPELVNLAALSTALMRNRFKLSFPNFGELTNLHSPIRHVGDDLEFSTHCFNDFAQGADVHVRASFHFGDGSLSNVKSVCKGFLSQVHGLTELSKAHF